MTTLQQDIVEWLRQAGEFDLRYTAQPDGAPSLLGIEGKKIWDERAAKVESARCENCNNYMHITSECGINEAFFNKTDGCWNFEPKVESK